MLKKLLSETALYGISSVLARLINYLLVPLHTGVMATDSYGIVAEFYAMVAILNVIYLYGMETAFFRFSSKSENDENTIYRTALTALVLSSTLFSGLIWWFSSPIAVALGYPEGAQFVEWFALLLGIDAIVAIPFARLRLQHKALKFASIKIGNVLANLGLNAFFFLLCPAVVNDGYLPVLQPFIDAIYQPEIGLGYTFLANLIANSLLIPFLWPSFWQWRPQLNWVVLRPMLLYAYPLIFSGLAFAVNEVLDRLLLKYWLPADLYPGMENMAIVGIYAACYKLSIFISLAIQGFRYAAEPFFFAQAKDPNSPVIFAKVMRFFIIVCCLMLLMVCANLGWISVLFLRDASYRTGLGVVPILLFANIFLGIYYNLAVWFKLTDKTYFGAFISLIGAAITLLGNLLLIPVIGYFGSALATLACYSTMSFISYWLGKKHFPIPYNLGSAFFYLTTTVFMVVIIMNNPLKSNTLQILSQNFLVLVFLLVAYSREKSVLLKLG